ncbi:MAG: DUF2207 domain-containing protein [Halioglobus sp.]|nr:DUF2207 domain-containing protein [Halioglobus sp.]
MIRLCAVLAVALATLLTLPVAAAERIVSFDSDIRIDSDGAMIVQESIRVVAEGKRIRRGIYREFPTSYRDRFGNRYVVDFDVLEVTRDGVEEPWHTEKRANGVRIYAGDKDVFLQPGQYTYRFTYRTDWQVGLFAEHDELYWNVTGNGWEFPMERASATVTLPQPVPAGELRIKGYTGVQGSRAQHYSADVADGAGRIRSTVPLAAGEGLTLVLSWPKGIVDEPGAIARLLHLLWHNVGLLLGLAALLGSAVYLGIVWHRFGRDPDEGVVFPHYEPPQGYSPASLRFIHRMGYDNKVFTAAVISLAVKGYIEIDCESGFLSLGKTYTLRRKPSQEDLAPGEREVVNKLFNRGATLVLENKNHSVVSAARTAHKKALQRDYRNLYFKSNSGLMLPSIAAAVITLVLTLVLQAWSGPVLACFIGVVLLHLLFAWLLRAPSMRGRRLMDRSEGFKLYLEVAEKDELNLRNPPEMTPQLFEAYLPFAIALGVEQKWAEQFSRVFAALRGENAYHPTWYRGSFDPVNVARFSQSVGSGLNSAISSAATAPGSSSGGGGGSSGGGGGGGGGGGW